MRCLCFSYLQMLEQLFQRSTFLHQDSPGETDIVVPPVVSHLKKTKTIVPKNLNLGQSGNFLSHDGRTQPDTLKSRIFLSAFTCVIPQIIFTSMIPFREQNVGLRGLVRLQNTCSYFERTEKTCSGRATQRGIIHSFPSSPSLCLLPHTLSLRLQRPQKT